MKSNRSIFIYIISILFLNFGYFININCQTMEHRKLKQEKTNQQSLKKFNENQNRVHNEYIVTLYENGTIEDIIIAFKEFKIIEISNVGDHNFLIKLEIDPGLEEINIMAKGKKGIKAIQPNFIYKAF